MCSATVTSADISRLHSSSQWQREIFWQLRQQRAASKRQITQLERRLVDVGEVDDTQPSTSGRGLAPQGVVADLYARAVRERQQLDEQDITRMSVGEFVFSKAGSTAMHARRPNNSCTPLPFNNPYAPCCSPCVVRSGQAPAGSQH